ncbi:hypothetical protein A2U01_0104293, partial [Trifolium medium]|nr:hypothetical protein [Trifolium medium]
MSRTTDPEWRALLASVKRNKANITPAVEASSVQASPSPSVIEAPASTKRDR